MRTLILMCVLLAAPAFADMVAPDPASVTRVVRAVVFADTVLAISHVTAVTIYTQGAQVTREVTFQAAAGVNHLLITDLPEGTGPAGLRLSSDDASLGAFSLRFDRLPPRDDQTSAEMAQATANLDLAEEKLALANATVAAIDATVEAQQAQIGFLTGIKLDGAGASADSLSGISQMIGTELLTARLAALAAQGKLPAAQTTVRDAQQDLDDAQAAVDAVSQRDENYVALTVTVEAATAGPVHLTISHQVEQAAWSPVYDVRLDQKAALLTFDRNVLVSQATGEDWVGVDLTLSTANLNQSLSPSQVFPELHSVGDPQPERSEGGVGGMAEPLMEPTAVAADGSIVGPPTLSRTAARLFYIGDTVAYHYPTGVDVALGVEKLQLALDQVQIPAKVRAMAVPRQDDTAYLQAMFVNTSGEVLLPGDLNLYRDGAFIGTNTRYKPIAPNAEDHISFGPILGLHLKRDMPERAEGDRGVFTTSTQREEKAVLEVENLTGEVWPVRVLDQVPYSEQEELQISYTAHPAVSEVDVEGKRGVLAWDFDLGPGEKTAISLDSVMSWPRGKVLQ